MEPNNPNYQPQDPSSQPIPQPQQPQPAAGSNPPYNAQPNQPQVYGSVDPQQTSPAYGQVPVGQPPTYPQQPGQPYMPQQPYASTPGSGNKKLLFGIIVGVVAILIVGGIVFALLSKKNSSTTSSGSSASNSTSSSSATTTSKSACELFTLSDAQSVIGSTAKAVTVPAHQSQIANATSTGCSYQALPNLLTIGVLSGGSAATEYSSVVSNFSQLNGLTPSPVSGLGDKATYFSNGTLVVQKGNVVFDIFLSESSPVTQSQVEQIATTMLDNF